MKVFTTLFARNYAERALALYRSLEYHSSDFILYGLCMDREAFKVMSRLNVPRMIAVPKEEVETEELKKACQDRDLRETCWTYSPVACKMAMDYSLSERVTYVDADTFFFSSPDSFFQEIGESPATIVPHRFPERIRKTHEINGKYNVNLVSIRRGAGEALLDRWIKDCTRWCYYRTEIVDGKRRMADQGYWDDYVREYPVHVVEHIGAGLAPWNCENYQVEEGPKVNSVPVIQYHFHEFERHGENQYTLTKYPISDGQRKYIYDPYIRAIESSHEELKGRA